MKTEQPTRKQFIDAELKKAGWNVDEPGQVFVLRSKKVGA